MAAGPAGVFFTTVSYAQTMAASGTAATSARRPPARLASTSPPAVSPAATPRAVLGATRPEGIGRSGRSLVSRSRSAQSLAAIPAQYKQTEAAHSPAVRAPRVPALAAPA